MAKETKPKLATHRANPLARPNRPVTAPPVNPTGATSSTASQTEPRRSARIVPPPARAPSNAGSIRPTQKSAPTGPPVAPSAPEPAATKPALRQKSRPGLTAPQPKPTPGASQATLPSASSSSSDRRSPEEILDGDVVKLALFVKPSIWNRMQLAYWDTPSATRPAFVYSSTPQGTLLFFPTEELQLQARKMLGRGVAKTFNSVYLRQWLDQTTREKLWRLVQARPQFPEDLLHERTSEVEDLKREIVCLHEAILLGDQGKLVGANAQMRIDNDQLSLANQALTRRTTLLSAKFKKVVNPVAK